MAIRSSPTVGCIASASRTIAAISASRPFPVRADVSSRAKPGVRLHAAIGPVPVRQQVDLVQHNNCI